MTHVTDYDMFRKACTTRARLVGTEFYANIAFFLRRRYLFYVPSLKSMTWDREVTL